MLEKLLKNEGLNFNHKWEYDGKEHEAKFKVEASKGEEKEVQVTVDQVTGRNSATCLFNEEYNLNESEKFFTDLENQGLEFVKEKIKEEFGMEKLEKRYFIKESIGEDPLEKTLIIAEPEDIIEKIELANMVYTHKNDIENIEEYRMEGIDSNENMELEEAKNYIFMTVEELTADEKYFLENEYIELSELEKYENIDIDSLSDAEIEKLENEAEKELAQSIIEKMKKEGLTVDYLETYKAWGYYDGSNWKEYPVEHWFYNTEWVEYTEELEGMEEIDTKNYSTGHKELFKLKDGKKILIDTSYYQGSLWGITFIDANVKTIEEAEEFINGENPYY